MMAVFSAHGPLESFCLPGPWRDPGSGQIENTTAGQSAYRDAPIHRWRGEGDEDGVLDLDAFDPRLLGDAWR